jgi:hypothetical protein
VPETAANVTDVTLAAPLLLMFTPTNGVLVAEAAILIVLAAALVFLR